MYRYVKSAEIDEKTAFARAAESCGWDVTFEEVTDDLMYCALDKVSPGGEAFIVEFQFENFEEAVERVGEYYEDFNKEDHADSWIGSYCSRALMPKEELLADAEAIEKMLEELYFAVREAIS